MTAEGSPAVAAPPAGPLLLGVRHHGPGSARAVWAALTAHRPRVVLVEGPPEADAVSGLAADPGLVPPVALLAHGVDDPGQAAFWPFASFSPEWIALRWAHEHGVPCRFIDLPAAHTLALSAAERPSGAEQPRENAPGAGRPDPAGDAEPGDAEPGTSAEGESWVRIDPLAVLAETAGYDDPERWWEDVVEHRAGAATPFAALEEAMTALRAEYPEPGRDGGGGEDGGTREAAREAHMRLRLREARKEFGDDGVAVVCGAWHVPALRERRTVTADRAVLKGLPKIRTEITWVPWTHQRLSRRSGYGAGITSPGWYSHLFSAPDRPVTRWLTRIAALLREEDHPISSAHVIEAVRLAESLAVMRGRPLAGLGETLDAALAVLCDGSEVPLALIRERLIVGDALGEVPESAPAVPLQRDLARLQRSLRLKPQAAERHLDLDLRRENDTARSTLLHRLRLLGVPWGEPAHHSFGTGTFRESWRLAWQPELAVRVAEAGIWGTTVEGAATAKAVSLASGGGSLADVTALAESCLLAGLDRALPPVMSELADRAALDSDVGQLARALPPLARSVRYGDVRSAASGPVRQVAEGLAERIRVGLLPAATGLNAEGAAELREHLESTQQAMALLSDDTLRDRWRATLTQLTRRERIPALLRGRAARMLLDEAVLPEGEAERLMARELSAGGEPVEAAAWIEGFLAGGGMLLAHDERLFGLVDDWLTRVPAEAFTDALPLLRRTFSAYEQGVRRTLAELARRGADGAAPSRRTPQHPEGFGARVEAARADAVLPVVRLLLGLAPVEAAALGSSPAERSSPAEEQRQGTAERMAETSGAQR